MGSRPRGLYVHLPFCRARCPYCDFAVALWRPGRPEAYVDLLLAEARAVAEEPGEEAVGPGEAAGTAFRPSVPWGTAFDTVFYGGGTPTTTPIEAFRRLHEGLAAAFDLGGVSEVTVEANPESLSAEYLRELRRMGVNRLSIGMQSADPEELRLLGRGHLFEDVRRAVRAARAAGFDNVSLDLMFGLPGQTARSWRRTLSAAVALEPEHISAYGLQVEPRTPFQAWRDAGRLALPDGDAQAAMYEDLRERLAAAGYVHYEISNFARPGRESRHNLVYWDNGDYLGLGVGAHSHWSVKGPAAREGAGAGWRWGNTKNLRLYREAVRAGNPPLDMEATYPLTPAMELGDAMMLGLRRLAGVRPSELSRRWGIDPERRFREDIEDLRARGLVERAGDRLRLTPEGLLLGNLVFERFVGQA